MSVNLPFPLHDFAQSRIAAGEFESLDAYVASLVLADKTALERALLQGLESGEAVPLDFAEVREKARARLAGE